MPTYTAATYAGETIVLQNPNIRFELHKRATGWGWGEIFAADGQCIAILEHLGELMLRDQEIPMRLEADEVERSSGDFGERLTMHVKSLIVQDQLRGTSFEPWLRYPLDLHCMEGEVAITLSPQSPSISLTYRLVSKANQYARYVRGPWLKVGEGSFGAVKSDAIFPGVEWLTEKEWSSGQEWFKDPWAMRYMPHPNKVSAPVMAYSHGGIGVGLAWDPNQRATAWFNYRYHRPQPVFASPNFIDRRDNHLMGLMVPDVDIEAHENEVYMDPPLELHLEQRIQFDAEIFLAEGNSLHVIDDWVCRQGLPPAPAPRWPLVEALDRIAEAYNTHLWHEGRGFGIEQKEGGVQPTVPRFANKYIELRHGTDLADGLQTKIDWCLQQQSLPEDADREALLKQGQELLAWQEADGSFPFDPKDRHYRKDDFVVATTYLEPMGLEGDSALDITILPALELIQLAEQTGEHAFAQAACKALDYCLPMQRPEGGDFWETPLHAPNLLAAGHAAIAYYLASQLFEEERYLQKAIYWLRALLPFTHLWEPEGKPMLYNTKPCLCSSDWYFANWVRDHVQWEVLETFALSYTYGIEWAQIDSDIDWGQYQQGITVAALRWILDHTVQNWMPHNLPASLDLFEQGALDMCFADTHNSVTGNLGGMAILPDVIALNILAILEKE
ncbi:MAG: hypothetical protein GY759_03260 [Chloroflexi bacterium]|nr:hypothetical protein [Chloroflexota bacterium]